MFLGLFLANMQSRTYGDAAGILQLASAETIQLRMHVAYLPSLALVQALLPGFGLLVAAKLFSAFCGALGIAAVYLLGRSLGQSRLVACVAATLAGLTPALWFYSTTVEVHTLQFALVGLGALVVLHSPWHRPSVAISLSGLMLVAAYGAHETSALLGPGWIVLCAFAARRKGAPLSTRQLWSQVAPTLTLLGVAASLVLNYYLANESGRMSIETSMFWDYFGAATIQGYLWGGVLVPLALLAPLAVVGLVRSELRRPLALFVLVPFAVLCLWRVSERGAYLLGFLPFLAVLGAQGIESIRLRSRPASRNLLLVVLGVQLLVCLLWTRGFDSILNPANRVELVEAVTGGKGTIVVPMQIAPPLALDFHDLEEISLSPNLSRALREQMPHEEFAASLAESLEANYNSQMQGDGLFVETHFGLAKLRGSPHLIVPYLEALNTALRARFDVEESQRAEWKIARLRPKSASQ